MATSKSVAKKASAKKKAASSRKTAKPSKAGAKTRNREILYIHIQEATYFLAEKDGFQGDPIHYWLLARKDLGIG